MTALGLVELTRKRVRASLVERLTEPCAACEGRGRVLRADECLRRLQDELAGLARSQQAEAAVVELSTRLFPLVDAGDGEQPLPPTGLCASISASNRGLPRTATGLPTREMRRRQSVCPKTIAK